MNKYNFYFEFGSRIKFYFRIQVLGFFEVEQNLPKQLHNIIFYKKKLYIICLYESITSTDLSAEVTKCSWVCVCVCVCMYLYLTWDKVCLTVRRSSAHSSRFNHYQCPYTTIHYTSYYGSSKNIAPNFDSIQNCWSKSDSQITAYNSFNLEFYIMFSEVKINK